MERMKREEIEKFFHLAKEQCVEVSYEESENLDYFETFFDESFLVKKETIIK